MISYKVVIKTRVPCGPLMPVILIHFFLSSSSLTASGGVTVQLHQSIMLLHYIRNYL